MDKGIVGQTFNEHALAEGDGAQNQSAGYVCDPVVALSGLWESG